MKTLLCFNLSSGFLTLDPKHKVLSHDFPSIYSIRVSFADLMTVLAVDNTWGGGDVFQVLPTPQLGTQYHVVTLKQHIDSHPSFFSFSALEEHTTVTFTTKQGESHEVVLNPYQSYRFDGAWEEDVTGTFIESDSPISLVGGTYTHGPGRYCCDDGVLENIPPVKSWGHDFVLTPFSEVTCGYAYRIICHENTTIVLSNVEGKNMHPLLLKFIMTIK